MYQIKYGFKPELHPSQKEDAEWAMKKAKLKKEDFHFEFPTDTDVLVQHKDGQSKQYPHSFFPARFQEDSEIGFFSTVQVV